MDLRFSKEDEAFRAEISGWLEQQLSGDFSEVRGRGGPGDEHSMFEERRAWERCLGQAGWTWYTGAAGWTWRLAVEGLLGLTLDGGAVRISPSLPRDWGRADIRIAGADGTLHIRIEDPDHLGCGRVELEVDGRPADGDIVAFPASGERHVTARLRPSG